MPVAGGPAALPPDGSSGAPSPRDAASATWVRFAGRLERDSARAVSAALTAAGLRSRLVAIDARALTFISVPAALAIREFAAAYAPLGGRTMIVRSPNLVTRTGRCSPPPVWIS